MSEPKEMFSKNCFCFLFLDGSFDLCASLIVPSCVQTDEIHKETIIGFFCSQLGYNGRWPGSFDINFTLGNMQK